MGPRLGAAAGEGGTPVDLAGSWAVALDPEDRGEAERWWEQRLQGTVHLPGSLQEQGLGEEITEQTRWTGQIVDRSWFNEPGNAADRLPGQVRVPFWLQPERHWVGAAWYQREIEIPHEWDGRRIVLALERPHWQTHLWLDGQDLGSRDSLSVPHRYMLSPRLAAGPHRLTLRVDNRLHVDVGQNAHSVSDHTQGNWNGVVGALRLEATDGAWIAAVRVHPEPRSRTMRVELTLAARSVPVRGSLRLTVEPQGAGASSWTSTLALSVEMTTSVQRLTLDAPLPANAALWDEFQPALHRLTVQLEAEAADGPARDRRQVVFGLRTFGTRGTRFTINDRVTQLRGTLDCCVFPATGYPPTAQEPWERYLRTIQGYGLNHVRFHSWCPPEAAFAAADRLGLYLQVECAVWTRLGDGAPVDQWLEAETGRILEEYGNHPSFVLLAHGNEPAGEHQREFLGAWVRRWRERDPRRLYTSGSGWPSVEDNDYQVAPAPRLHQWGDGLRSRLNATPPATVADHREQVERFSVPLVAHEAGQWCAFPDFGEIARHHGLLRAKNFEIFRDSLQAQGLGAQARDFHLASGRLQALCYREEVETALRTPGLGGFQLLGLMDFPGQGTALVGLVNALGEPKDYCRPEDFARCCGPTVPLARLPQRLWTTDQTLEAGLEVAHAGAGPLPAVAALWSLRDRWGGVRAQGRTEPRPVPLEGPVPLGEVRIPLNGLEAPAQYRLQVELEGAPGANGWDIWLYPAVVDLAVPAGVQLCTRLDEALEALGAGGRVLLLAPPSEVRTDAALGFTPVFWNTAWTGGQPPHTLGLLIRQHHPALAAFPTSWHSDWQWWDPLHGSAAMVIDGLPSELRPLVQPIDTWFRNHRLALIFEARVGPGSLLLTSANIGGDLDGRPAARQLLASLLAYAGSEAFAPGVELGAEQLRGLFQPKTAGV